MSKLLNRFPKVLSAYVWFGSVVIGLMILSLKKVMEHFIRVRGFDISTAIVPELPKAPEPLDKGSNITLYRQGGIGMINRDGSPTYTESVLRQEAVVPTYNWDEPASFTDQMTRVSSLVDKMVNRGFISGEQPYLHAQMDEMMGWPEEALAGMEKMFESLPNHVSYGDPS